MTTPDFRSSLIELAELARKVADTMGPDLDRAYQLVRATVDRQGTLLFCGNGGSAADAQHMATEYVVRYLRTRRAYPAIALTTDTSLLTAAANDLGFETVFARQVEALGKKGDLLIIHSTSGNSPNVLKGAEAAKACGMTTVAWTGGTGGKLAALVDFPFVVPSKVTARIQESHITLGHVLCELTEEELLGKAS